MASHSQLRFLENVLNRLKTNQPAKLWVLGCLLSTLYLSCISSSPSCDSDCEQDWLDGSRFDDPAWKEGKNYDSTVMLSTRFLPDSVQIKRPVVICVHGFSASTFEWLEFAEYLDQQNAHVTSGNDSILVSRVLLGGHGRNLADFEASNWKDWREPILDEWRTLVKMGYRNISFAGSSTGADLILQALDEGFFDSLPPNHLLFIDPIIESGNKLLTLVNLLSPIIQNSPTHNDTGEQKYWYTNRPSAQLSELYDLINRMKNRLESGMTLPPLLALDVWKSRGDEVADPVSALYLKKGIRGHHEIHMVNSDLHVFTRLRGRKARQLSHSDTVLQKETFQQMRDLILTP